MNKFLSTAYDPFLPMLDEDPAGGGNPPDPSSPPTPENPPNPPAPEDPKVKIDAAAAAARRAALADAKKAQDKAAQDLGYKDHDDMIAQVKAAKDAQKTEQERQAEALAAAQKKADDAEAAKNDALTKANQRLINAEVRSLAREMGAVDLEDVETLLPKAGIEIKIDDDGNVTGVKEALEALKASKGHLFAQKQGAPPPIGGGMNPPKKAPANMLEATPEEFADTLKGLGLRPHSSTKAMNPRKG
jgi:hypothetical protein